MSIRRLQNAGAALLALTISVASTLQSESLAPTSFAESGARVNAREMSRMVDATGTEVPRRDYQRIISGSTVVDSLLLALADPTRVAAYTHYGSTASPYAYRLAGKPTAESIEEILSLRPDLVLLHAHGRPDKVARLREAGVAVFDLGEMKGISTLLPNIRTVARLLGHPDRGEQLARSFQRRMHSIASHIPQAERPQALYLSVQPSAFFGGTIGSSYHDVLIAAGLRDVAGTLYTGWPKYSTEHLLELDPEIVVTHLGMGADLCRRSGLEQLRACTRAGRIVEVDPFLIGDPSLYMLEAASTIFERVFEDADDHRRPS